MGQPQKNARKRFMIFLVLLVPESNISKVGQNWAITKGLHVTSKKMAAVKLITQQCIHHSEVLSINRSLSVTLLSAKYEVLAWIYK